jgi:hypothetical protein
VKLKTDARLQLGKTCVFICSCTCLWKEDVLPCFGKQNVFCSMGAHARIMCVKNSWLNICSVGPLPRLRNFTREKDSVAPGHVRQLWKESLPHSGEQELKQRFNSHVHIYKI